jgi:molybdopterin-containing oxidoreductase family membrane subunit
MSTATMPPEPRELVPDDPRRRLTLVHGGHSFADITRMVCAPVEEPAPRGWWIGFGIAFACLGLFVAMVVYLVLVGIGIWGLNNPQAWGFDITNFVWWVGIGHAGTLISAILYLFRQ